MKMNKRGFNDTHIVTFILGVFLLTAFMIPITNQAFGLQADTLDTTAISDSVMRDSESVNSLNVFTVLLDLLTFQLFDFSGTLGLPAWLSLFYSLLNLTFLWTIARNIWIGGGA